MGILPFLFSFTHQFNDSLLGYMEYYFHAKGYTFSKRRGGYQINQEDLGFLSPFGHAHINLYGQFFFQPFHGMDLSAARKEFEPLF